MTNSPKRIAFCITELDPGGAEKALVRIVTSLDRKAWEPKVYCLAERGPLADVLESAEVPVVCLGARSWWNAGVVLRLARELRRFRPVLLQTFLFHGNIVGRFAALLARVPIVVSGVRVVEPDARWRHRLDAWTNRLVTRNVCVSEGVARTCRQAGIPSGKLTVIPNGVDVEAAAEARPVDLRQFGIPTGTRVVIGVGRLHPQKGFYQLIEATEPLLHTFSDVHLLIVGEGPQRDELTVLIRMRQLDDRVHLPGWRPDVAGLLKASDVFVLSSVWEGMPNALLEAMAVGLPVVATQVEGVEDLVTDGETGLVVCPEALPPMTDALSRLLTSPELRTSLGTAAQVHVSSHFTWINTCQEYADLYRELTRTAGSD